VVVVEAALGVAEGVAIAEGRAAVHAHAKFVDQPHIAFPVAALAAHVDDGGGALLDRVQEHEGAQRGHGLGRRRRHLALERGGEAHVVRRAVVVFRHVEEEVVAAIAGGVDMGIDESRRHKLSTSRETRVDRARVRPAGVHDAVVLENDAPLLVHFVALAVERHHPAAFDEGFHGGIDSNRQ